MFLLWGLLDVRHVRPDLDEDQVRRVLEEVRDRADGGDDIDTVATDLFGEGPADCIEWGEDEEED